MDYNLIILKLREKRDISLILSDISTGREKTEFEAIYRDATKEDMNFLKIDINNRDENKFLSKSFTGFYPISD